MPLTLTCSGCGAVVWRATLRTLAAPTVVAHTELQTTNAATGKPDGWHTLCDAHSSQIAALQRKGWQIVKRRAVAAGKA